MKKLKNTDLIFIFKYVIVACRVDEEFYSKDEALKIRQILSLITNCIYIDKSYVEFEESNYEKTFMTHTGWDELCKLVISTGYGKHCTRNLYNVLYDAYRSMILCYIYQVFEDLGYDIEGLYFLIENNKFLVEYELDNTHAWKTYPGKWQKLKNKKFKN